MSVRGRNEIRIGEWSHLTVSYDGTDVAIYVNGRREDTIDVSGGICESDGPIIIGRGAATDPGFRGELDEARLYNRALHKKEVFQSFRYLVCKE